MELPVKPRRPNPYAGHMMPFDMCYVGRRAGCELFQQTMKDGSVRYFVTHRSNWGDRTYAAWVTDAYGDDLTFPEDHLHKLYNWTEKQALYASERIMRDGRWFLVMDEEDTMACLWAISRYRGHGNPHSEYVERDVLKMLVQRVVDRGGIRNASQEGLQVIFPAFLEVGNMYTRGPSPSRRYSF